MLIYCVSACLWLSHTDTDTHTVPKILLAVRLWDWDSSTRGRGGAWRAMSEAPPTQSPSASSYIRDFPRYWLPHGRSEMCHHAVHTHQQKLQAMTCKVKSMARNRMGFAHKKTRLTWLKTHKSPLHMKTHLSIPNTHTHTQTCIKKSIDPHTTDCDLSIMAL